MANPDRVYRGASAIVTGGASGIGRALGEHLARLGARVSLLDLQADLAERVAAGIRAAGGDAEAAALDVTDFPATETAFADIAARRGRLDFAFNNAGIWMMGDAHALSLDDVNRLVDVNLRGAIHSTKAAYDIMLRQKSGHIINTASVAGLTPDPGCTAYSATKHAIVGLSKSLRIEAARHGIRVSALCPGVIETPLLEGGGKFGKVLDAVPPEKMRQMWARMRPMNADAFAQRALHDVARNKPVIVWPIGGRLFWWLDRISPRLSGRVARDMYASNQRLMGLE
jgi:NAD(P)-dependent dehydrogenase (short-subunit alcohol dehydrogenase family)